jgi:hypothetical protein
MHLSFSSPAFLFFRFRIDQGRGNKLKKSIVIKVVRELRVWLFRAGVAILLAGLSPLSGDAAGISLEDDFQETCELNGTIVKKAKNNSEDCISTNQDASRANIPPDDGTTPHLFAERTALRDGIIAPAEPKALQIPAVFPNEYKKALQEYLSVINTLPAESDLQPLPVSFKPFLKKTNLAARSFSAADLSRSKNKITHLSIHRTKEAYCAADKESSFRHEKCERNEEESSYFRKISFFEIAWLSVKRIITATVVFGTL